MANNTMGNTNSNRQGSRGSNQNQGTAGTQRQAGRNDMEMDNTRQEGRRSSGSSDSER
jgi:hypothetical protein